MDHPGDRILSDVDEEDLRKCLSPRIDAPVLLPAYLDLWCQTAPAPAIEPDVGLFLHGKKRNPPEARVVWRADLPLNMRPDRQKEIWTETVALCPPVSGEMLSMPLHRLRAWLDEERANDGDLSDIESTAVEGDDDDDLIEGSGRRGRAFLIWRGRDKSKVTDQPDDIRPNDVIVVPSEYPISGVGQSAPAGTAEQPETLGGDKLDLWEFAWKASGKPPALRVNRAVLSSWCDHPLVSDILALVENEDRDDESVREAIDAVLEPKAGEPLCLPDWLIERFRAVRHGRMENHPAGGVVLFARRSASDRFVELDLFADDDDLLSATGRAVSIADHTALVERATKMIASHCLPQEFLDPLLRSARWHDIGKLDNRFQLILRRGDEIANDLGKPLAKSAIVPTSPGRREAIRAEAGLPKGFRHEMLSLQLVERHAALPAGELATDLVLHLVASHHGHARPFAPVIPDPDPPAVAGHHDGTTIAVDAANRGRLVAPHRLGSGVPDRFWRLTRRHGWWGLAYLEAVLRLGDWYGSEHTVGDEAPQTSALPSPTSTGVAPIWPAAPAEEPIVLTGLDGANPLGFLAALGALLVLRQGSCPEARLGWKRTATWQPVLTRISSLDRNALCVAVATALRGRPVSDDAERARMAAQKDFDAARKSLKDKRDEIRDRGLRGGQREAAIKKEVIPLEEEVSRKRAAWLGNLKSAVPSPELALGKHIDCNAQEYRDDYAASFLEDGGSVERRALDLLAAFASDACIDRSGRISATPFCFITGSGHQYFLDTARQLMTKVDAARVRSALFEPWTYNDKGLSLRWDPKEAARYALMDVDPGPLGAQTVQMANLLAYRALGFFASAPGRGSLETTGWRETHEGKNRRWEARRRGQEPPSWRDMEFTWPIWHQPADPDTIRSHLLLADLGEDNPDRSCLRARGIVAVFRSRRVKIGSGANFKINFEPGRGV